MNFKLVNTLTKDAIALATQWANEQSIGGGAQFQMLYDKALITLVVRDIVEFIAPPDGVESIETSDRELLIETQSEIKHRYEVDLDRN
jgi:hypothetical protein